MRFGYKGFFGGVMIWMFLFGRIRYGMITHTSSSVSLHFLLSFLSVLSSLI